VVADRLGLPAGLDPETSLRASSASSAAIGFARLASTPGISAKVSTTLRKLFPTPSFMRHWSRLARRGAGGLALAYAWRPLWLLLQLGPAAVAWRRARK
jgi:hypothetical protein